MRNAKAGLLAVGTFVVLTLSIQAQDDNAAAPISGPAPVPAPAPAPDNGAAPQNAPATPTADDATGQIGGVTFQSFYDSLSPYGTWISTEQYGYVWQPTVNDPNWSPYTDGNWVYTDSGWTWNSNEPWGWATYHYGRWVNIDGTGWVWVPGYTWAPAWVSWRYGDNYVGWAPLPPDSMAGTDYYGDGYNADYGFHIGGDADEFYGIGPVLYIFLPVQCVCYHDYHHWYHDRYDNYALINHTTNVTNINVGRGGPAGRGGTFTHVTAGGPQVEQIDAASENHVPRASLVHGNAPGASALNGGTLTVFAPHVRAGDSNVKPAQVTTTLGATNINRGTDLQHPPTVNARFTPTPATDAQIAAAQDAAQRVPPSAKVLTDASNVRPIFQGHLTALKPVAAPPSNVAAQPGNGNLQPGSIYNNPGRGNSVFSPVHNPSTVTTNQGETPSERAAREQQQQHVFNTPTPNYMPHYVPPAGGNETQTETHTFTHVTPAPVYTPAQPARTPTYTPPPEPARTPAPAPAPEPQRAPAYTPAPAPSGGNSSGGSSSGGGSSGGNSNGSSRTH